MSDYLANGALSTEENVIERLKLAFPLINDFTAAVDKMNSEGVIHHDLKLENILLTEEQNVLKPRITDFGLSERVGSRINHRFGTAGYVDPHATGVSQTSISQAEYPDGAFDVWASGVVACQLIMGTFHDVTVPEQNDVKTVANFTYTLKSTRKPGEDTLLYGKTIPEAVSHFLDGVLNLDSQKRFTSDEMALEAAVLNQNQSHLEDRQAFEKIEKCFETIEKRYKEPLINYADVENHIPESFGDDVRTVFEFVFMNEQLDLTKFD